MENMFEKEGEKEKKRDCSNKVKSDLKLVRNKKGIAKSSNKDQFIRKVVPSKEKQKIEIIENKRNDTYQSKKENSIDWCESSRKWLEKKFDWETKKKLFKNCLSS